MVKPKGKVCKICRRVGTKLLLKGEKCFTPKCPILRKPYPPGFGRAKRRTTGLSDYAQMLREKQKFKRWYNLKDNELKNLVKEVLKKKGNPEKTLIEILESRLESIVLRAGFASSRREARQLISHRFFKVGGRVITFPSFRVKVGNVISLNEKKLNKKNIEKIQKKFKEVSLPSWLQREEEKGGVILVSLPRAEECLPPCNLDYIFELYSK